MKTPSTALFSGALVAAVAVAFIGGCQQERLPTFARTDERTALSMLAQRSLQVSTISGSGTLELTKPNGESIRLDLVVAMQPPERARLRAWKFGHAVFDLTITPEALWLESPKDSPKSEGIRSAGTTAAQVTRSWSLLNGGFFAEPGLLAQNDGDTLVLRRARAGEPTVVCRVDRDTLTPRQYQLVDDAGQPRFSLALDHYHDFDGIVWPRRVVARSEAGRVVVELSEVTLNEELPAAAFQPPRRAEKLP